MRTGLVELDSDHPGFQDPQYRRRRNDIARLAQEHRAGDPPARLEYTAEELRTWEAVYGELTHLYPTHACREYNAAVGQLKYTAREIPQLADVSEQLQRRTGFRLEPVAGLVSPREFLGGLARRVFYSTQYVRHHNRPHYTPEPDVVHELMGHAPMLAIEKFADLSQQLGEGAESSTEEELGELATLYWYTVEYGVVREQGKLLAYGAGLLSSFGELSRALHGGAELRRFDPWEARRVPYPITQYQPVLWEVESIAGALHAVREFILARWSR